MVSVLSTHKVYKGMTCHGYEMIIVCLSLITGISEILALLKGVECNGIVHFIIHMLMTRRRCAEFADIELPNVPPRHTAEVRTRRSLDKPNEP